jgi:EAL domain-containing protein (putative c-di-GMP-specific phosphodiesterase class I)
MPPGAFLPLAERYGLMPKLDRWVVRQVLKWASTRGGSDAQGEMFCVNVSGATMTRLICQLGASPADTSRYRSSSGWLSGSTSCVDTVVELDGS